jgi:hypothetical protein
LPSISADQPDDLPDPVSPLENEISGLKHILTPRFDPNSPNYIGDENKDYLQKILLEPENTQEPIPVSDWERIIRILFSLSDGEEPDIDSGNADQLNKGTIERQYAISSLMKLLSESRPYLIKDYSESVKKSELIMDINEIKEENQIFIRQAYCLGLTDYTVDSDKLFRPEESLNSGEAISILFRTLANLKLADPATSEEPTVETVPAVLFSSGQTSSPEASEGSSVENLVQEYKKYLEDLKKLKNSDAEKKLNLLNRAENIVNIDPIGEIINETLSLDQWRQILHEVFGIGYERIDPYQAFETNGTLPYDIAAITIFKLSEQFGGYETRDAAEEELEKAREAIPQFDTARDISKFAQMFSSGLLDGLYQIPGFTPQRPVNRSEALLIIKRMIEDTKFK